MSEAKETGMARLIADLRRAHELRVGESNAALPEDTAQAYLSGALEPGERADFERSLLGRPELLRDLRRAASAIPASSRLAGRLAAGRWLGPWPIALPARAVAFADRVEPPFHHTFKTTDDIEVSLVEEAGGALAVHVRSGHRELAGQTLVVVLTPEPKTEPLTCELPLQDLGDLGSGGYAVLGTLAELLIRLGTNPECAVVISGGAET